MLIDSQWIPKEYDPNLPYSHAFLVVTVDDQKYLVDPGFGSRSPKFPVPLNFELTD